MTEKAERLRSVVLGRLESLERAGVLQLPKARARPVVESAEPEPELVLSMAVPAEERAEEQEPIELPAIEVAVAVEDRPIIEPAAIEPQLLESPAESALASEGEHVARNLAWARSGGALFEAESEAAVPASTAKSLAILQKEVAPCTRCGELAATRTQTVFGVGNPKARLCFMGEAPGADEDRLGEPFVGRGGQLLNKIIEACQLKREDVYILNTIKCRPPGNRNPLPEEAANCRPYLERQLELIEPEYICCLGAVASKNLLGVETPIGKLRGMLHTYRGAKVVCTYHPAYLLRNPAAKKDCWDDMKFLMRQMGVEL